MESVNENENELFQYGSLGRCCCVRFFWVILTTVDGHFTDRRNFFLLCISSSFVTLTRAENLKFKFFQKKNFRKEGEQRADDENLQDCTARDICKWNWVSFMDFQLLLPFYFRECEAIEKICWSRAPNGNESLCSWPSNKKRRREISSVDGKYASLKFINKICLTHTQQRAQESSVSSTATELQIMDTKNRRLKCPY